MVRKLTPLESRVSLYQNHLQNEALLLCSALEEEHRTLVVLVQCFQDGRPWTLQALQAAVPGLPRAQLTRTVRVLTDGDILRYDADTKAYAPTVTGQVLVQVASRWRLAEDEDDEDDEEDADEGN
jgi:hypothetical protein